MQNNQGHSHAHTATGNKLILALAVTAIILVAEVVGGLLANSLALLSDAGHVLTDLLALALSWYGVRQSGRPAHGGMTFGYLRVGILIAAVNAVSVIAIAGYIFYEAFQRLQAPQPVAGQLMMVVAAAGLLVNLGVMALLWSERKENLNIRSAFLHVAGDALSSVGVIIGGAVILLTGYFPIDPALSILIGLILIFGAWGIIKESLGIFLGATPGFVDMGQMVQAILQVPGVRGVHDLHVWTVSPQLHALSCHITLDEAFLSQRATLLERLNDMLLHRFDIEHSTVQFDCVNCDPNELYCGLALRVEEAQHHH